MTLTEAKIIAAILVTADGGCMECVGSLFEQMNEAFPEFKWEVFQEKGSYYPVFDVN